MWYGIQGMAPGINANLPKVFRENLYAIHTPLPITEGVKWIASLQIHEKKYSPRIVTITRGDNTLTLPSEKYDELSKMMFRLIPTTLRRFLSKTQNPILIKFYFFTMQGKLNSTQ